MLTGAGVGVKCIIITAGVVVWENLSQIIMANDCLIIMSAAAGAL